MSVLLHRSLICQHGMRLNQPTSLLGLYDWINQSNRSSGTFTRASLGLIVQNGKFSAGMDSLVRVLNSVDLPTFGKPTCEKPIRILRRKRHDLESFVGDKDMCKQSMRLSSYEISSVGQHPLCRSSNARRIVQESASLLAPPSSSEPWH